MASGKAIGGVVLGAGDLAKALREMEVTRVRPTVQRRRFQPMYPGVYKPTKQILEEARAAWAAEDPMLRRLWGTNRGEMADEAVSRQGLANTGWQKKTKTKGGPNENVSRIMVPGNQDRLASVLRGGAEDEQLREGMAWYVQSPLFRRLLELMPYEKAVKQFQKITDFGASYSPLADVNKEIARSSYPLSAGSRGRTPEDYVLDPKLIMKEGGPGAVGQKVHAKMLAQVLSGKGINDKVKAGVYANARGVNVPDVRHNYIQPTGDSHWSRAVGLSDTRTGGAAGRKGSVKDTEANFLYPWFDQQVSQPAGINASTGQPLLWQLMGPQTGVTTEVGKPLLELQSGRIAETARALRQKPENVRDRWLRGRQALVGGSAAGAVGLGALAPTDESEAGVIDATLRFAKAGKNVGNLPTPSSLEPIKKDDLATTTSKWFRNDPLAGAMEGHSDRLNDIMSKYSPDIRGGFSKSDLASMRADILRQQTDKWGKGEFDDWAQDALWSIGDDLGENVEQAGKGDYNWAGRTEQPDLVTRSYDIADSLDLPPEYAGDKTMEKLHRQARNLLDSSDAGRSNGLTAKQLDKLDRIAAAIREHLGTTGKGIAGAALGAGALAQSEDSEASAPTFFSELIRAAESLPKGKASPQQYVNTLRNMRGVKQEELDYYDIARAFADQKSITNEQLVKNLRDRELKVGRKNLPGSPYPAIEAKRALEDAGYQVAGEYGDFYIAQNGEEVPYDDLSPAMQRHVDTLGNIDAFDGEFAKYPPSSSRTLSLPGAEDEKYRESLTTLSVGSEDMSLDALSEKYHHRPFAELSPGQQARIRVDQRKAGRDAGAFTGGHYDTPNTVLHSRLTDRVDSSGNKMLMAEEHQSDWHAKAARMRRDRVKSLMSGGVSEAEAQKMVPQNYGYRSSDTTELLPDGWEVQDANYFDDGAGGRPSWATENFYVLDSATNEVAGGATREEAMANARRDRPEAFARWVLDSQPGVPDAPFKKSWTRVALKQQLRDAVDAEKDSIGWTTGAQQADRYDLSHHLDRIDVNKVGENYNLSAFGKNHPNHAVISESNITATRIEELVGKDIADRAVKDLEGATPGKMFAEKHDDGEGFVGWIVRGRGGQVVGESNKSADVALSDAQKYLSKHPEFSTLPQATYSGLDLRVGGESKKRLYDEKLVNEAKDLYGKYGGKVVPAEIPGAGRRAINDTGVSEIVPATVHSMQITPEMRALALRGQPLFKAAGIGLAGVMGGSMLAPDSAEAAQMTHQIPGGEVGQKFNYKAVESKGLDRPGYKEWRATLPKPLQYEGDYDLRGLYNEQGPVHYSEGQHMTDKYKRTNHPTFSNQSMYSTPENPGGTWKEETYVPQKPTPFNSSRIHDLAQSKRVSRLDQKLEQARPAWDEQMTHKLDPSYDPDFIGPNFFPHAVGGVAAGTVGLPVDLVDISLKGAEAYVQALRGGKEYQSIFAEEPVMGSSWLGRKSGLDPHRPAFIGGTVLGLAPAFKSSSATERLIRNLRR